MIFETPLLVLQAAPFEMPSELHFASPRLSSPSRDWRTDQPASCILETQRDVQVTATCEMAGPRLTLNRIVHDTLSNQHGSEAQ